MSDHSVYVPVERMREFAAEILLRMGVPRDDARITAEILIAADLWGIQSHGIAHLKLYHHRIKVGHQRATTNLQIVRETPTTAVADGGNGMGQVVGFRMMNLAIEKARQLGMGMVAVRNSSHYGAAGYYAKMATDLGLIGMSVTNARPAVTPTFGAYPLLGTNPIAFGAPTDEPFPFLYDACNRDCRARQGRSRSPREQANPRRMGDSGRWRIADRQRSNSQRYGDEASRVVALGRSRRIDGWTQRVWLGNDG